MNVKQLEQSLGTRVALPNAVEKLATRLDHRKQVSEFPVVSNVLTQEMRKSKVFIFMLIRETK